jgi:hypothetical protein
MIIIIIFQNSSADKFFYTIFGTNNRLDNLTTTRERRAGIYESPIFMKQCY